MPAAGCTGGHHAFERSTPQQSHIVAIHWTHARYPNIPVLCQRVVCEKGWPEFCSALQDKSGSLIYPAHRLCLTSPFLAMVGWILKSSLSKLLVQPKPAVYPYTVRQISVYDIMLIEPTNNAAATVLCSSEAWHSCGLPGLQTGTDLVTFAEWSLMYRCGTVYSWGSLDAPCISSTPFLLKPPLTLLSLILLSDSHAQAYVECPNLTPCSSHTMPCFLFHEYTSTPLRLPLPVKWTACCF